MFTWENDTRQLLTVLVLWVCWFSLNWKWEMFCKFVDEAWFICFNTNRQFSDLKTLEKTIILDSLSSGFQGEYLLLEFIILIAFWWRSFMSVICWLFCWPHIWQPYLSCDSKIAKYSVLRRFGKKWYRAFAKSPFAYLVFSSVFQDVHSMRNVCLQ